MTIKQCWKCNKPSDGKHCSFCGAEYIQSTDDEPKNSQGVGVCPNGHTVVLATGNTLMTKAGYYWCSKCESKPRYIAMSGDWAKGMYYPPSMMRMVQHA